MVASLFRRLFRPSPDIRAACGKAVAPPLVIGALGGSGTRAISRMVRHAQWWMGVDVCQRTEDSLAMREFLRRWFVPLLDWPDLPARQKAAAEREFLRAMAVHRRGIPSADAPWGWKNPRNMWLLKFYLAIYPELKFLHLVRDGRDMALSKNLFLLDQHGDRLLGKSWRKDPVAAQLAVWAMGNERAVELARDCKSGNYLRVRYEDVCSRPQEAVRQVFAFLDAGEPPAAALSEIEPSTGIGRWRSAPADHLVYAPPQTVQSALAHFGYAPTAQSVSAA